MIIVYSVFLKKSIVFKKRCNSRLDSIECAQKEAVDKEKKRECIVQNALPQNIIVPVRDAWFCSAFAVPAGAVFDADVHG